MFYYRVYEVFVNGPVGLWAWLPDSFAEAKLFVR